MNTSSLRVGGFVPMTTIDYPDHLSCVVFCQGCPWKCRYCHNPTLSSLELSASQSWNDDVLPFLEKRQGMLEAVVFSGGEPTYMRELPNAMQQAKALGFKVALHTAGIYPRKLKKLFEFTDWIGFDIKALPEDYPDITGVENSGKKAWQSLQLLLEAKIPFECRTTVHWKLIKPNQLLALGKKIAALGVKNYAVQICRTEICLDPSLPPNPSLDKTKNDVLEQLSQLFENFQLRFDS